MSCSNFPIDQTNLRFTELFSNLQGNILKGHGRPLTRNILMKFTAGKEEVKSWIRSFAQTKITSFQKQLRDTELYKRNNISGEEFYSFFLSSSGLKHLGLSVNSFEESFQKGMASANLNDPPQSTWDNGFQKDQIDALILIAFHDEKTLEAITDELRDSLNKIGIVFHVENGNALHNGNGDGIEHFGYVDGISQPLFFKDESDDFNNFNSSLPGFDPLAPNELSQVLLPDPLVENAKEKEAYGSYFVFRKLEQNVKGFKIAEKQLALSLGLSGDDTERAGAMIVGRFEDGTPVTLTNEDGLIASGKLNGFNYTSDYTGKRGTDTDGSRCPFHAHIRKVNPRTGIERNQIMARRGIPYGLREADSFEDFDKMPEGGVGLLFQSYQSSIANQFEEIQKAANSTPNGSDPIIGQQPSGTPQNSTGDFATVWGNGSSKKSKSFNSFVTLKGGEYFFAPSLLSLRNL